MSHLGHVNAQFGFKRTTYTRVTETERGQFFYIFVIEGGGLFEIFNIFVIGWIFLSFLHICDSFFINMLTYLLYLGFFNVTFLHMHDNVGGV